MPSVNFCMFAGNVTNEPALQYTHGNTAYLKFAVAVTERYKDKNGDKKETTSFIPCVAWAKTAEFGEKCLHKGTPVLVEGKLQQEEWKDKDNNRRTNFTLNVTRLSPLAWDDKGGGSGVPAKREPEPPQYAHSGAQEDDIPF